jgi:hypothetical protein
MCSSIRLDLRCPWLTLVTVVAATLSSRATSANELPTKRSLNLMCSCCSIAGDTVIPLGELVCLTTILHL